jgi:hypothetical protein
MGFDANKITNTFSGIRQGFFRKYTLGKSTSLDFIIVS